MAPASEKHVEAAASEAGQTLLAAATAAVLAVEDEHAHTHTAVFSTDSTASTVTLPSRQTSQILEDDEDGGAPHIHRVASEQLLPRTNELTPGAAAARMPSVSMGRVTVTSRRRQRNPRRFVVTELPPEHDDLFLSDGGERAGRREAAAATWPGTSAVQVPSETGADAAPPKASRPAKMEVRGRFTIIDLSPDSATQAEDEKPTREAAEPTRPVLRGSSVTTPSTSVRRRPPPRRLSRSERASSSTSIGSVSALQPGISISDLSVAEHGGSLSQSRGPEDKELNGHAVDMPRYRPPPQQSPMRVDLSALDRHLVFLQQESHDMKALLESMISSNARWISALSASSDSNIGSGKHPKAVHPASTPTINGFSAPSLVPSMAMMAAAMPLREPTLEEKYERLHKAFCELEEKHAATMRENVQLQRHNIMLDTRLRQEMSVNDELRAHVDQLTQYTESLIIGGDTPTADEQQQSRLTESMSSASTEVSADAEQRKQQGAQQPRAVDSGLGPPATAVAKPKHHERTMSDMSIASSALWMMDNNQSGLEDDDEDDDGGGDVDDTDNDDDQSVQAKLARYRRRRMRILSRSTSMDDSASSVYSSSYRDSWMSVLDPHRTSTSDWRSMSFDAGADGAVVDEELLDAMKRRHQRLGSSDDATVLTGDNQADELQLPRLPWQRRRKSSSMIVEELANPADDHSANGAAE